MITIQRILVPTDFSEHSRQALRYGIALAEKFSSELHLIHVVQDTAVYQPDAVTVGPAVVPPAAVLTAAAREALANMIAEQGHER